MTRRHAYSLLPLFISNLLFTSEKELRGFLVSRNAFASHSFRLEFLHYGFLTCFSMFFGQVKLRENVFFKIYKEVVSISKCVLLNELI